MSLILEQIIARRTCYQSAKDKLAYSQGQWRSFEFEGYVIRECCCGNLLRAFAHLTVLSIELARANPATEAWCVVCSKMLFCIPLQCADICFNVTFLSALTSLALLHWPLSLTMRFCLQNYCSLYAFCFSQNYLQTVKNVVSENSRRSVVSEILKPPCLAPIIIPRSKITFFPILTFGLKNSWTSWPCPHTFMHFVSGHIVGRLNICINKALYRFT